eukprot:TRINITY_DN7311_c0_g4_i3.p2 TRINITY_DN7311_c0_g4~~TRINITY_DN7311_c0_g4_i3.p2  ORF type:complete len:228 (-),score=30.71 TRINITY_DN7311_c0_g4_i3:114-797(-)
MTRAPFILFVLTYHFAHGLLDNAGFAFSGQDTGFGAVGGSAGLPDLLAEPEVEKPDFYEGVTPAKVVIEKVVAYPDTGEEDAVVLRNQGGQIADLTGWSMTDSKADPVYVFGQPGCEGNATILPQDFLVLSPESASNPCGFTFGISFRDAVILYDDENNIVANVSWESSEKGSAIRLINGQYVQIPEVTTIMDILFAIEEFSTFATAIKSGGFETQSLDCVEHIMLL